jgi:hypothetical protein
MIFGVHCFAAPNAFEYTLQPGTAQSQLPKDTYDSNDRSGFYGEDVFAQQAAVNKLLNAASSLTEYYINFYKNCGMSYLARTQINAGVNYANKMTFQGGFSTIQPFFGEIQETTRNTVFWQLSYNYNGASGSATNNVVNYGNQSIAQNTANVGLGYRYLFPGSWALVGVNGFFDATMSPNHMRSGAGLELFVGPLEFRANQYIPMSGEQKIGVDATSGWNIYERAAAGMDYEIGTNFSYLGASWLNLAAQGYQYTFNQSYNNVLNSNYTGYNVKLGINVLPELKIEAIYNNNSNGSNGAGGVVQVSYNLNQNVGPSLFNNVNITTDVVNRDASSQLIYKMLQPVYRNNNIVVERFTKINAMPPSGTGRLVFEHIYTDYTHSAEISAGSQVSLFRSDDISHSNVLATIPYASGGVIFDAVAPGTYIVARSPYNGNANAIVVPSAQSFTVTANAINNNSYGYLMGDPGSIRAVIMIQGILAPAGTNVRLSGAGSATGQVTGAGGVVSFTNLMPGSYTVALQDATTGVYGTLPYSSNIVVVSNNVSPVTLSAYYRNVSVKTTTADGTTVDGGVGISVAGTLTSPLVTTDYTTGLASLAIWENVPQLLGGAKAPNLIYAAPNNPVTITASGPAEPIVIQRTS